MVITQLDEAADDIDTMVLQELLHSNQKELHDSSGAAVLTTAALF